MNLSPTPRRSASRLSRLAAWGLLIYWPLLLVGTHLPAGPSAATLPFSDKLIHFTAYAILAGLAYFWLRGRGLSWIRVMIVLWFALALHGIADELTQGPVPGRSPDPLDALADTAGISVGLLLARLIDWIRDVRYPAGNR
jgi:VanZ family protein